MPTFNPAVGRLDPLKRDQSLMTPEEYKALIHNPANWVAVSGGSLNDTNFFVTPEPTSAVCLALGIGWLGLKRRRSSV